MSPEVDQDSRIVCGRKVAQDLSELAWGEFARSTSAADHLGQPLLCERETWRSISMPLPTAAIRSCRSGQSASRVPGATARKVRRRQRRLAVPAGHRGSVRPCDWHPLDRLEPLSVLQGVIAAQSGTRRSAAARPRSRTRSRPTPPLPRRLISTRVPSARRSCSSAARVWTSLPSARLSASPGAAGARCFLTMRFGFAHGELAREHVAGDAALLGVASRATRSHARGPSTAARTRPRRALRREAAAAAACWRPTIGPCRPVPRRPRAAARTRRPGAGRRAPLRSDSGPRAGCSRSAPSRGAASFRPAPTSLTTTGTLCSPARLRGAPAALARR